MGNYDYLPGHLLVFCVIPLREKMGNYDQEAWASYRYNVIPLREKMGNYDPKSANMPVKDSYTTTRENGELRRDYRLKSLVFRYTTTRENGKQRQCLSPKYSVRISPHIISAFSACVNPPSGEKRFNKNSPWKWMLPSLEFPWQDFIWMTAEMQFAF